MVQPRIVHPNVQLIDVTARFIKSAQNIPTGQLVKDEGFTLFEAVGALEIGDPKMDSGALAEGEDLEDDFDATRPITSSELMWIIDQLLCREVSWHQGYPLSQTLFTSVHLDRILWPDPKQIEEAHFIRSPSSGFAPSPQHELLRAYCLGLVKCCDLVLSMVTGQHYYEEEDFATQVFNREMLRRFTIEDVLALMKLARTDLGDSPEQLQHHEALLSRLTFRIEFLELLSEASDGRLTPGRASGLLDVLSSIQRSTSAGTPLIDAFSIKIQRRLASSVPPRPMVACEEKDTFSFLNRLLRDISAAFEILDVSGAADLHTAFWTLMSQESTPCIYVRSLAQSFLNLSDRVIGKSFLVDFVADDMRALVLPASALLDSRVENPANPGFQIGVQMNQFIDKVAPSFQNQFRSFALNRSRVRRNLCHAAIEWDNIQAEAEEIDGYLQTLTREKPLPYGQNEELAFAYSLSSWVYHHKLQQLRFVIQLGFELEVYAPGEFVDMYWYLGHISGLHLSHLERISYFIAQARPLPHWTVEAHRQESQKALGLLYRHFSWLKATDTLASALQRVFVVLRRHGHFTSIGPTYSSDELRYELRMRPFQHLSIPEPISHEEMKQISSLEGLSDREVLDQAMQLALTSRKAWDQVLKDRWHVEPLRSDAKEESVTNREWTKNVKNSMKACIGTSISITTLAKALEEEEKSTNRTAGLTSTIAALKVTIAGSEEVERFHRWWAVPTIVKGQK